MSLRIASFNLSSHKIKLILFHYFDYLHYFDTFEVYFPVAIGGWYSFSISSLISVIERIIAIRLSFAQSSNAPSIIERAKRNRLPDMRLLSIVLIVMLISYAKINNYFYNSLDYRWLNRFKKIKKQENVVIRHLLYLKVLFFEQWIIYYWYSII